MSERELSNRIEYMICCIGAFAERFSLSNSQAYKYLKRFDVIITEKHGITLNGKPVKIMKYEGLIIIDGKEATTNELSHLKAEEIAKMENYKAGSKVAESYGKKGKKGIMMITTKANMTSGNIYLIDGKRVEKSEVDKLSPDKIASIKIDKKEGNSVFEITTKK